MPEKKIRVVLGDFALNLEGMSAVLKGAATFNIVATADSPKKLTDAVKKKSPDVVVVDSEMLRAVARGINGVSKVIQLADADSYVSATPATRGVVRRTEGSKGLKEAIRRVAKGQTYAMPEGRSPGVRLSKREQEIAKLVGRGLTNRSIAQELELSEQSVKNLVSRVLKKAGLDNRVQLALAKL